MIFPLPSDVAPAIFLLSAPMGLAIALVLRLRYLRAYGTGRGIRSCSSNGQSDGILNRLSPFDSGQDHHFSASQTHQGMGRSL